MLHIYKQAISLDGFRFSKNWPFGLSGMHFNIRYVGTTWTFKRGVGDMDACHDRFILFIFSLLSWEQADLDFHEQSDIE